MSNNQQSSTQFVCPTSMVLLKAICDAFAVSNKVHNSPGSRIGAGDEGRTARRVFSPDLEKLVPAETRANVLEDVILAFLEADVIDPALLEVLRGTESAKAAMSELVHHWTVCWDGGIRDACDGWPYLPKHLAGFVVARCVAIDLACRVAALAAWLGKSPASSESQSPSGGSWDHVLEECIAQVPGQSQAKKATALDIQTRTLQRWRAGKILPTVENLILLAERASPDNHLMRAQLLRRLKLWRARQHLRAVLEPALTPNLTRDLFHGFERIARELTAILDDVRKRADTCNSNTANVSAGLVDMARQGLDFLQSPSLLGHLINRLMHDISMLRWCGELKALSDQALPDRLQAAFQWIGDWPQFINQWNASPASVNLEAVPTPEHYALRLMDPLMSSMISLADSGHIPAEDLGITSTTNYETGNKEVLAMNLLAQRNFANALPLLRTLVADRPDDCQLLVAIGICYRETLDWELALQHLQQAIACSPDWEVPWVEMGQVYFKRGMPEQAAREMSRAPEQLRMRSSELNRAMGKGLLESGQVDQALASFLLAVQLNETDGWSWYGAAECAFRLGKAGDGGSYARKAHHLGVEAAYRSSVKE
jgi:Flp pilus assembly protein TadD